MEVVDPLHASDETETRAADRAGSIAGSYVVGELDAGGRRAWSVMGRDSG